MAILIAVIPVAEICHAAEGPTATGAYRQVYVTSDSAPGWTPSIELERTATETAQQYLAAVDAGHYAEAYAFLADQDRQETAEAFASRLRAFNMQAGPVIERQIIRITWTKDPAAAPAKGLYAAIDLTSRFREVDRHCGYLVLYQPPSGGAFRVMREESNYMSNEVARSIAKDRSAADVEGAWAKLSSTCPNYASPAVEAGPPAPLPESASSTIGYPTVAAALKDLHSKPQVKFRQERGWTVATDDKALTFWSFAPPEDPAYPAAVRRQIVQEGGGSVIEMKILCEATKAACDNLVRTFEQLNERMAAELQGRASH